MNTGRKSGMLGLGFRAARGGSIVVGVEIDGAEPRVLLSTFLATAAEGDRLSLEPYHVAAELARGMRDAVPAEAVAAVTKGRQRQADLAVKGLGNIRHNLSKETPIVAALLVNRAGWIGDLLQYSLVAPEHPPIAEGLAVRDALRHALGQSGIEMVEMDEKSLPETASVKLQMAPADLEMRLNSLRATVGRPWRKEQKLACLAAWLAAAAV